MRLRIRFLSFSSPDLPPQQVPVGDQNEEENCPSPTDERLEQPGREPLLLAKSPFVRELGDIVLSDFRQPRVDGVQGVRVSLPERRPQRVSGKIGHDAEPAPGIVLGEEVEGDRVVDGKGDDFALQGARDHVFAIGVELQAQEGMIVLHVLCSEVVPAHTDDEARGRQVVDGMDVQPVEDEERQGVVKKPRREVEIGAAGIGMEQAGVKVRTSFSDGGDRLVEIAEPEGDPIAVPFRPELPELDKDPLRLAVPVREREGRGVSLGGHDKGLPSPLLEGPGISVCGSRERQDQRGHREDGRQEPAGSCGCMHVRHRARS